MYQNFNQKITIGVGILLSLMLAGTSSAEQTQEVKVAFVSTAMDGLVPQLALAQGFFQKHNLRATLIAVKSGPEMVSAMISGSADFSEASPQIALPAIAKGAPIIYLMSNYDLDYSLLVKPIYPSTQNSYPSNIVGLKGKRVGVVGRGGLTELFVRKMFKDAGLDPDKDVSIIAVGAGPSAIAAFQNDQIDALVSLPPTDTLLNKMDFKVLVSNRIARDTVFGKDFIASGVAANADFVKQNPDTTKRYCEAYKEAIAFLHRRENRRILINFISQKMNLTPAQAEEVFDVYGPNYSPRLSQERWNGMKKTRSDVPAWSDQVYLPCAEISLQ